MDESFTERLSLVQAVKWQFIENGLRVGSSIFRLVRVRPLKRASMIVLIEVLIVRLI